MTNYLTTNLPKLRTFANSLYSYYGGSVYLFGSALTEESPRDIDVRVVIDNEDFERLYGNWEDCKKQWASGEYDTVAWRYSEDRLKRIREAYDLYKLPIDFAVWHQEVFNNRMKIDEYMRLDTHDEWLLKKSSAQP